MEDIMKPIIRSSFAGVALAFGLSAAPFALAGAVLVAPAIAEAKSTPTIAEMKQTLADYGQFITVEKYGEVWKPTVTPRGWHPYPACDWVYTKQFGWYFSDKTVWGSIVHHYGRWFHDATEGWLWQPGAEFSPGWVVWRTSEQWVGWAPTPPDVDLTPARMEEFNDDKLWTFMDAKKFGATCEPGATVANYGDMWKSTTYVTDIRFVDGVSVFVLPAWITGPVVNIDIDIFAPWSPTFIGSWVWNWTSVFNDVDINITVNQCTPKDPKTPNDPKNPDEPKDPQQPNDPQNPNGDQPGPNNPKPFRPSLKDNTPPPAPGINRRPRPENIDTPQRQWRQPNREARTFEAQPDDVVIRVRRPGRQGPDAGQPDRGRKPNREAGERRPQVDVFPDGRFPQREVRGRKPERLVGPNRTPDFERKMSPHRSGGESQGLRGRTFRPADMGQSRGGDFRGGGRAFRGEQF
jgi:hypothetical protein